MLILWSICNVIWTLSRARMLIIGGGVPFGVYAIVQVRGCESVTEIPLTVHRISTLRSSFNLKPSPASHWSLGVKPCTTISEYYLEKMGKQLLMTRSKWQAWTSTLATIALAASFGLMEMILILTLRVRPTSWLYKFGGKSITSYRVPTVEALSGRWCLWQSLLQWSKSSVWSHHISSSRNVAVESLESVRYEMWKYLCKANV